MCTYLHINEIKLNETSYSPFHRSNCIQLHHASRKIDKIVLTFFLLGARPKMAYEQEISYEKYVRRDSSHLFVSPWIL